MILNELRIMGGPNLWSVIPKIITIRVNLTKFLQPDSEWFFTGVRLSGNNSYYAFTEYADKDTGLEAAYSASDIINGY